MAAQKKAEEKAEQQNPAETAQPSDPTRCGGYVLTNEGWVMERPDDN